MISGPLPPFGRITGIRFNGYNLSPLFLGTPSSRGGDANLALLQGIKNFLRFLEKSGFCRSPVVVAAGNRGLPWERLNLG